MKMLTALRIAVISIACVILVALISLDYTSRFANTDIRNTSVTITNMMKTSGGSGVVVGLLPNESEILTNFHVCDVIKDSGGFVNTVEGSFLINSFLQDNVHDLCIIKINTRLSEFVQISSTSPKMFDELTSVGHPKLLPTIVNKGHLSSKQVINVLWKIKPCEKEDFEKDPMACIFLGGIPSLRTFEASASSLLTQPGSSGSGVFDKNNRLTNLVFAGSGDMAFGFLVPFEYVAGFYNTHGMDKSKKFFKTIDYTKSLDQMMKEEKGRQDFKQNLKDNCKKIEQTPSNELDSLKRTCESILKSINWGSL